jgi:hypothetical protein
MRKASSALVSLKFSVGRTNTADSNMEGYRYVATNGPVSGRLDQSRIIVLRAARPVDFGVVFVAARSYRAQPRVRLSHGRLVES